MHYHEAFVYVTNYLRENYVTILTYLGAGGGISLALQFLKKLRHWEKSAWIQFVLGVFTVLASTADYVINNYSTGPIPTIFGDMAPKLLAAAMIMHRVAVSPLTKLIQKQIQNMVTRAAVKAADSVSVTGTITPRVASEGVTGAITYPEKITVDPGTPQPAPEPDVDVEPMT